MTERQARISAAMTALFQGERGDVALAYYVIRSRMDAAIDAADAVGRERVSEAIETLARAVHEAGHSRNHYGELVCQRHIFAVMDSARHLIALLTAAPAECGEETTLAFPVRAEDYVTGPELSGVIGDGPTFFLSEDTYLAADTVVASDVDPDTTIIFDAPVVGVTAAAPAVGVGVTVVEAEAMLDRYFTNRFESIMTDGNHLASAFLKQAEAEKANIIALLTEQPEPGTRLKGSEE